jgi:hypothetical protein
MSAKLNTIFGKVKSDEDRQGESTAVRPTRDPVQAQSSTLDPAPYEAGGAPRFALRLPGPRRAEPARRI